MCVIWVLIWDSMVTVSCSGTWSIIQCMLTLAQDLRIRYCRRDIVYSATSEDHRTR
jgi:hypothetical protein